MDDALQRLLLLKKQKDSITNYISKYTLAISRGTNNPSAYVKKGMINR